MKRSVIAIAIAAAIFCAAVRAAAIDIQELNGSDLGMGVGARAISMAGAFTALADDTSALYWNPAGIATMDKSEAALMIDTDPTRYSFKAAVFRPEAWRKNRSNWAIGVAQTNRLKFIADGDWSQGNASHLIDLSMIRVEPTYVGGLNSRTTDKRLTLAGQLPGHPNLKYGVTYVDFECVTTFFNTNTGRTCQIVAYDTFDFGFLYSDEKDLRIGFSYRNPFEQTKPKYMNFGLARIRGSRTYTLDFERIFGEYGTESKKANFFFIRGGMERDFGNGWKGRGGIILPLQAKTSTLGNIRAKLPDPKFNATLGAGHTWKTGTTLDFALYGDPGRSYVESDLKFGYVFTVRQRF